MKFFDIDRNSNKFNIEAFEFFKENGYVILFNFMNNSDLLNVKEIVDNLAEIEKNNNIADLYGVNSQRIWNLLNKNIFFHDYLLSPQIELWMNKIFDRSTNHRKFFLSSFQANILYPGTNEQILHTDTPIPEPIPPYAIKANTLCALDDFTELNGATEIIPKSHTNIYRPPRIPNSEIASEFIKVIMPAGSLIITHGNLWHRAGSNEALNKRTALLGSFAASYAREISSEDDTVRFLSNKMRKIINPRLYDLIGGNHGVKLGNNFYE